ncbi:hypothetical protein [Streptomyces lasiicapitis]|uniref:hypothetical protein n=1 Tax=Streptomyces lasiicapitis TaxID=1923961 RepID=UPI0036BA4147
MSDYPEIVAWLTKKAREFRANGQSQHADTVSLLASKVARGAVRPDNLRMLPAPGFFEAGRTYSHGEFRFACEYLTTHPTSGRISAWGWFGKNGAWRHAAFGERQYQVRSWADVTETGQALVSQHYDKVPDPVDGCHWCACGNRWPCKHAGEVAS